MYDGEARKALTRAPATEPQALDVDRLYRAHFAFVWRSLRRLGVPPAALDDATQEVFLVVHRKWQARADGSERAWLFAIAQRVASDQRRWQRRKGHALPLEEEHPAVLPGPLEQAITRQATDIVLDFLASIDGEQRAAFILSELEQMTAPEIATATESNLNTVYYRIAAARKLFIKFAEERLKEQP